MKSSAYHFLLLHTTIISAPVNYNEKQGRSGYHVRVPYYYRGNYERWLRYYKLQLQFQFTIYKLQFTITITITVTIAITIAITITITI